MDGMDRQAMTDGCIMLYRDTVVGCCQIDGFNGENVRFLDVEST